MMVDQKKLIEEKLNNMSDETKKKLTEAGSEYIKDRLAEKPHPLSLSQILPKTKPHCGVCRNWTDNCICPMEDCSGEGQGGPLRIVAAAVVFCDMTYAVKPPARHHNVLHMCRDQYRVNTEVDHRQGFLMSDGKFIDRTPATKVAREAGQLIRGDKDDDWPLTSEDLW